MLNSTRVRHYQVIRDNDRKHLGGIAIKASYILLQVFDLALSLWGTSLGAHELNPVMRGLLTMPAQLLVIKLVIPLIIVWFVPSRFIIPAAVLLLAIIGWNIKELLLFSF